MTGLTIGDIYRYDPSPNLSSYVEGTAVVVERYGHVVLLDTYWASEHANLTGTDRWSFWDMAHTLTSDDLAGADMRYNLADFRPAERGEDVGAYAPGQVICVTAQHAHIKMFFVRHGAERSNDAIIARQKSTIARKRAAYQAAGAELAREEQELARLLSLHENGEAL